MGFFDDLNTAVDVASAEDIGFANPPEGAYYFKVANGELKIGTKKDPNAVGFIVHYELTNGQDDKVLKYGEYFGVPQPADPRNPTEREQQQASFLKNRLLSLGVPPQNLNSASNEDIEDVTGTLKVTINKGGYVALRDVKIDEKSEARPVSPVQKAPARKAPPTRTAAPKPEAAPTEPVQATAPEAEEGAPTPTNPAPTKPAPAKVVGNPFAR